MSVYLYLCVAQKTGSSGTIKENVLSLQELETEAKPVVGKATQIVTIVLLLSLCWERKETNIIDKLIP
jgi:hypothetical protein